MDAGRNEWRRRRGRRIHRLLIRRARVPVKQNKDFGAKFIDLIWTVRYHHRSNAFLHNSPPTKEPRVPGNANLTGGVAELVLSAGPIAKVVLSILAVFSIICWALIVEKWWEFRRIKRASHRFVRVFRDARRFSVVYGAAKKHRESPFAQLYLAAGQELSASLGGVEIVDRVLEESDEGVAPERLDAISRSMRRAASTEI